MKANKALKRLTKIETLISDVTERYSTRAPHIRELLQGAKAAVARAKDAVSFQASSGKAKNHPVEHSKPSSKATPKPAKPKRRISKAGMARIVAATKARWARVRAAKVQQEKAVRKTVALRKAARKSASVKKAAATKAPITTTAPVPAPAVTEAAVSNQ